MFRPNIEISDYTYTLPQERIASYPLDKRDSSKLLIYNKGIISEDSFSSLPQFLEESSILVYNNTKVVPARLLFRRETGAFIEIFCLEPAQPNDYNISFLQTEECSWKVIVGNKKKWKGEPISLYVPEGQCDDVVKIGLKATLISDDSGEIVVKFTWESGDPFSKVLESCGKIPIPPYLNRETELIDNERYQTLYAQYRGSVAAPTAGLHFTDEVFSALDAKGISRDSVCLHVGAGTFLPVKSKCIAEHQMHSEQFSISLNTLNNLYQNIDNKKIVAVGTTSVRTLESLYYLGVQCVKAGVDSWTPAPVQQWDPYNNELEISSKEALGALITYMEKNGLNELVTKTRIIIVPSYKFKIVNMLVTNFHQPQSTLLLLIAAFIGEDWRKVYQHAMDNDFRFLSYGDSSLLIP